MECPTVISKELEPAPPRPALPRSRSASLRAPLHGPPPPDPVQPGCHREQH